MVTVDVIIPSRNEGPHLLQTVESLKATAGRILREIVVVDDGSDPPVALRSVPVIRTEGIGVGPARNLGQSYFPGADFVVFCDAHVHFPSHWLEDLLDVALSLPDAAVLCPAIRSEEDPQSVGCGTTMASWGPPMQWKWSLPSQVEEIALAPGGCQLWRTATFQRIGRFCPYLFPVGGEDVEVGLRAWLAGYKLIGVPSVQVTHLFKPTMPKEIHKQALANQFAVAWLHFSPSRLVPAISTVSSWPPEYQEHVWAHVLQPGFLRQREVYNSLKTRTDAEWFERFEEKKEK